MYRKYRRKETSGKGIAMAFFKVPLLRGGLIAGMIILCNSYHASAQEITLSVRNAPLKEVLTQLYKQSKFRFIFTDSHLKISDPVTINVKKAALKATLDEVFKSQPLTYTIVDKAVVIKEKKKEVNEVLGALIRKLSGNIVRGTITNSIGNGIAYATVSVKKTTVAAGTRRTGEFFLYPVPDQAVLEISCLGYRSAEVTIEKEVDGFSVTVNKSSEAKLSINSKSPLNFTLKLDTLEQVLKETQVIAMAGKKKAMGAMVDLTHRNHLNLGQLLEGTVPGLTMKRQSQVEKERVMSENGVLLTTEEYTDALRSLYKGLEKFVPEYNQKDAGKDVQDELKSTEDKAQFRIKNVKEKFTPELRGSSSLGGGGGPLVILDGFPQDDFPADFPVANIASVEVVKDPSELIKWGARARGGLILITTRRGKNGRPDIGYQSIFSYSSLPDISRKTLGLASSSILLDYMNEGYPLGTLKNKLPTDPNLDPAEKLMLKFKQKGLPQTDFDTQWNALKALSNYEQLGLLRQPELSQNHSLTVSGGSRLYQYMANGRYAKSLGNVVGDRSDDLSIGLNNKLNLFKNKLNITWIFNANKRKLLSSGERGKRSIEGLKPYQMLLDEHRNYVYNYPENNDIQNMELLGLGYNTGVNGLEDTRSQHDVDKRISINSGLNVKGKISPDLSFTTNFKYTRNSGNIRRLTDPASSEARNLVINYATPVRAAKKLTALDLYVPQGGILRESSSYSQRLDLQTTLNYQHSFSEKSILSANVGLGGSSNFSSASPDEVIYGYNVDTGLGQPIRIPVEGFIHNVFETGRYPGNLLVSGLERRTNDRMLSINTSMGYTYDQKYTLGSRYTAQFLPRFGYIPVYSATTSMKLTAGWAVEREAFFKIPWVAKLGVSVNTGRIKVANQPLSVGGTRGRQPLWEASRDVLTIKNYRSTEQLQGQEVNHAGLGMNLDFTKTHLSMGLRYDHFSMGGPQLMGSLMYDVVADSWFHVPAISSLNLRVSLQALNPYQSMLSNIEASTGGGYMNSGSSSSGLPERIRNVEAGLELGLDQGRHQIGLTYYSKTSTGLSDDQTAGTDDAAAGGSANLQDRGLSNSGLELFLRTDLIKKRDFSWTVTLNGAYNTSRLLGLAPLTFNKSNGFLTAPRNGYAEDNLWSYRWAGLDNKGNPQVYDGQGNKVTVTKATPMEESWLEYTGRSRAPLSGGLIQEWNYKGFFLRASVSVNLGHVFRRYVPVMNPDVLDQSVLIAERWQEEGDELKTDVAAMAVLDPSRSLVLQNSSNSILPADHIRLQEIQLAYDFPASLLRSRLIKNMSISLQTRNVALWVKNKQRIDPDQVASDGTLRSPAPRTYSVSLSMNF